MDSTLSLVNTLIAGWDSRAWDRALANVPGCTAREHRFATLLRRRLVSDHAVCRRGPERTRSASPGR
jgi:hypothetical protein